MDDIKRVLLQSAKFKKGDIVFCYLNGERFDKFTGKKNIPAKKRIAGVGISHFGEFCYKIFIPFGATVEVRNIPEGWIERKIKQGGRK